MHWIELQLWFHPIPVRDIFGHNGRGSNIILSGHTRDANCSTMFFLSLSLTLSRLCEEARVERTEHVSIKNTWTPSNSFQVGDFEMTLDSLDDPFFQNWKQWLAAKVQSQEPQDQHHAAPGRALPWQCFFCCASQFMAWRSCANASLGMMGMLGQVWYHPVPWPAKQRSPGLWGSLILVRPKAAQSHGDRAYEKCQKDSKGGNTTKPPSIITNLTSVIDSYRHLWPSMATLRQGCEDRHGDHSEEPTPEDYGLTLHAGNIWKHPLVGGPLMSSWRSQKRKLILGIDHWNKTAGEAGEETILDDDDFRIASWK